MQVAKITQESATGRAVALLEPEAAIAAVEGCGQKVRAMLKAQLGEDIYSSWFNAMTFESFDGVCAVWHPPSIGEKC